ncbi:hypothetical protein GLOIN_2v1870653 [Rhizophagus irregularis DAOM 181602=DAOM 197198]|uniref:Uncharacterized protein n=1 Tax=Rhizophagus irregularis (strain DAOM 181602 / DAOM 197198 / MUCL 43194) TaxID=747089 RepID=A0A2P4QL69_RHIID|nr:hypothetical protein GLOIN_2v1870653 [Rhizophagus irregularis DAOM 181602=DAOM 197198]POG78375.1 hypothetical protein GLOIN_2v1870653 [Rhizophagus irregularis DAOM 181602=DAOM 197198]|eukprot:XP_025185241.1 hypothetical protein GLOIN_2v1870653 [Rhizophagus irregularis DAOM 181602=DAOM 197198]
MAKSSDYNGLNPVVVQALNNLQYRYSGETPEIWCSRMIERSYKDGEFKAGRRSFHIYCTVCDSLVIINENTIECANKHLNECITKSTKKNLAYSNPIRKNVKKRGALSRKSVSSLSSDRVDEIYLTYCFIFKKGLNNYTYEHSNEIKKRIVNRLINNVRVIQQAWRSYKKRPASFASQIWNELRNDGTTDEEKFLGGDWVKDKKIQLFVRFHKVSVKMIEISEYYHRQVTAYPNKLRDEIIRLAYSHFGLDNYIGMNVCV